YFPIMMIVNEPGSGLGRPPGGGGGPGAAAIANSRPVLRSNASVRAPFDGHVFRSCSTSKLVGLFSLTMVIVPLPCELNASIVAGLKTAPSELPASGNRVKTFPSFALRMTNACGGLALGSGAGGAPPAPRAGAGPTALHAANRI